MKAVVTAGGRIDGTPLAELTGENLKCLIDFGGRRLLDRVLDALHATPGLEQVVVVAPEEVRERVTLPATDRWLDDTGSGPGNFLAGIRACADEDRVVFSTSDLPFLEPGAITAMLSRCPEGFGVHYPIFTREEVQARFPRQQKSQKSFMPLTDGDLTGSSVMVIEPRRLLDRGDEIESLFNARKDFRKLASVVGVSLGLRLGLTLKCGWRVLSVQRIVDRFSRVAGFPVQAVRGCDPCLGFDIDHERNWQQALAHLDDAPHLTPAAG